MIQRVTWVNKTRAKLYEVCCFIWGLTVPVTIGMAFGAGLASGALLILALCASPAKGAGIPAQANRHKATLIKCARLELGMQAPIALIAAQIHQESAWRESAVSPAGAQGLAQFMPATAKWLPDVAPALRPGGDPSLAPVLDATPVNKLPFAPAWALRAVCAYNRYLYSQITGAANEAEHWAFTLRGYNGGPGWINKDRRKAKSLGLDPGINFGVVDTVNSGRSPANFAENTQYPRRIFSLAPRYVAAGWGRTVTGGAL